MTSEPHIEKPRSSGTRRAVLACIATTLTVALVELFVGWRFDLISVFAEGLHTGADLMDSIVALVLISVAIRPPDSKHPFGHGKFDSLAGVCEGLCVIASGVWAIFAASRVLLGYTLQEPRPGLAALATMVLASAVYWTVSHYVLKLAKRTGSATVYAEGVHLRSHIYVTAGLLAGLALTAGAQRLGWRYADRIDPVMAAVLGVVLIGIGIAVVRVGLRQMFDTALPEDEQQRITEGLNAFRGEFIEVHAVRTRQAGAERHVDIHLVVAPDVTVSDGHDLSHRIEAELAKAVPGLQLLVHVEPASDQLLRRYAERGRCGVVRPEPPTGADEADHHAPVGQRRS